MAGELNWPCWGLYRSLEVKLPTWTDGTAEVGRVREEKRREETQRRRESIRRKKMQVREKVGKSRNTVFFQWFVAPEGRKVGSLKRRVRSHLARWDERWTVACRCAAKHIWKLKCTKQHVRTTFGSWDVKKVNAVVARSTCQSQNVQNTPTSDQFWKLRCRKSARRCGAKHISKDGFRALLDVQMSFRLAAARDCAPCQKWAKRVGFLQFQLQPPLHYTPLQLHLQLQLQLQLQLHYATLQCTNYITLR